MAEALFETVPNFSEGRDIQKVERIARAASSVPGVRALGLHSDPDHNRSVLTLAGGEEPLLRASVELARACASEIDLAGAGGSGVHPRVGSLDVLPFIPLEGAEMEDAVRLARRAGGEICALGFAVYLYEAAASAPERRNLADLRRGGYEGLAARTREPLWSPDYGAPDLDPRLGAVAVGARPFLVAFNAYLDTGEVEVARAVAREVRERDGGLLSLKALGLEVAGRAQVSMNLTDLEVTSLPAATERVRAAAAGHGARVDSTELVGLLPLEAVLETARYYLGLPELRPEQVLEYRLRLPG
ncbi:MAG: glutamate formimidoyltransferase [Rubrobacter sp.]|nr:glutamate formimidoyltransferase [Rubrobacter sp.]